MNNTFNLTFSEALHYLDGNPGGKIIHESARLGSYVKKTKNYFSYVDPEGLVCDKWYIPGNEKNWCNNEKWSII
jgi:hypothetical protein